MAVTVGSGPQVGVRATGGCDQRRSRCRRTARNARRTVARHSGCGPRSSATASGVCSRTIDRDTCAGQPVLASAGRRRPSSRRPAARVHAAGWASRARGPARSRRASSRVEHDGARRKPAADQQPGDRADVGEPAPPDAEHQQRAERRGGHRERQPDRAARRRRLGASTASTSGTTTATTAADPERATPAEPPAHHVLADHAGDRDGQAGGRRQERRERAGRRSAR